MTAHQLVLVPTRPGVHLIKLMLASIHPEVAGIKEFTLTTPSSSHLIGVSHDLPTTEEEVSAGSPILCLKVPYYNGRANVQNGLRPVYIDPA